MFRKIHKKKWCTTHTRLVVKTNVFVVVIRGMVSSLMTVWRRWWKKTTRKRAEKSNAVIGKMQTKSNSDILLLCEILSFDTKDTWWEKSLKRTWNGLKVLFNFYCNCFYYYFFICLVLKNGNNSCFLMHTIIFTFSKLIQKKLLEMKFSISKMSIEKKFYE